MKLLRERADRVGWQLVDNLTISDDYTHTTDALANGFLINTIELECFLFDQASRKM